MKTPKFRRDRKKDSSVPEVSMDDYVEAIEDLEETLEAVLYQFDVRDVKAMVEQTICHGWVEGKPLGAS